MKILLSIAILLFTNTIAYCNENKTYEILKNLRCLVCQGQTISDSNSDFALTIKEVVSDKVKAGLTKKEIYNFLSDKYGDWILYKPKINPGNLLLWGLPYLALISGGVIIVFLIRKSSKKGNSNYKWTKIRIHYTFDKHEQKQSEKITSF